MKIGFYLDNSQILNADLSNPELGNPGVGGTQYLFAYLPYLISKHCKENITIYAHNISKLPENVNIVEIGSFAEAVNAAKGVQDFFVYRPTNNQEQNKIIRSVDEQDLRIIAWAHNTPEYWVLNNLANSDSVKAFINVSREQYDRLRGHEIFNKSTYILNPFDVENFIISSNHHKESRYQKYDVVYIGSLTPVKGFHVLASVWPKVLKKVPDATLGVIGSGTLYNEKAKLGKYGIAEKSYENRFIPYLTDKEGKIIESVTFLGKLGHEKKAIMNSAKVGIVNPSGKSENCPGSALEFQSLKVPVVSAKRRGLLDTVIHNKTGLLYKTRYGISEGIIKLLLNPELAHKLGKNGKQFVDDKFAPETICAKWNELFFRIGNGESIQQHSMSDFKFENFKLIRELMRIINDNSPIKIPPIQFFKEKIKKSIS